MTFHVVIPARYGATRLPGKPLRRIAGRPMIAHVIDRARESGAASVVVATDDARVVDAVGEAGGEAMMTRADHASGTDRVAEVAAARGWPDDAVVVNLQGDEPRMPGRAVAAVAKLLATNAAADLGTLATPIAEVAELFSPHVVKVVLDDAGLARWFSRAPLPWVRDAFLAQEIPTTLPAGVPFLRHLGLYAYRVGALHRLTALPPHPHEEAERLEQLRALCAGLRIAVHVLDDPPGHGVDTEADLARVEALFR